MQVLSVTRSFLAWPRTVAFAAIVSSGLVAASASDAQTAANALRMVWDKSYGSAGAWSEFRAIAATGTDEVWVAASERDSLEKGASSVNRLLLWRIDAAGQLASETEIKRTPTSKGTNTATIRDIVALSGREALLLVNFEGGRPAVVRVDRTGAQTAKQVAPQERELILSKIVPASNGRFLLIGHEALDALAIEIDASGTVLWEKKQDRGRMDFLVDGLSTPDGGFVLVGNSGDYDPVRSGPSLVWVGRYDRGGEMKTEITFPGRHGSIARSRDSGYVVVYDKSASPDQEIHVKGLGADVKELWDERLLSVSQNFAEFKILALSRGFAITGRKIGRPYLALIDSTGHLVMSLEPEQAERSLGQLLAGNRLPLALLGRELDSGTLRGGLLLSP